MKTNKNTLKKDKYIAALMNMSQTTLIDYKQGVKYAHRYKSHKLYFNSLIDMLSEDDVIKYCSDLKLFTQDLKNNNILKSFNILE